MTEVPHLPANLTKEGEFFIVVSCIYIHSQVNFPLFWDSDFFTLQVMKHCWHCCGMWRSMSLISLVCTYQLVSEALRKLASEKPNMSQNVFKKYNTTNIACALTRINTSRRLRMLFIRLREPNLKFVNQSRRDAHFNKTSAKQQITMLFNIFYLFHPTNRG